MSEESKKIFLAPEIQVTRRKNLHYLVDENDKILAAHTSILTTFSWLIENQIRFVTVRLEDEEFDVEIFYPVRRADDDNPEAQAQPQESSN